MNFNLSKDKILLKKNLLLLLFLVSTVILSLAEKSEACKLDHFQDVSSLSKPSSHNTFFSDYRFVISDALSFDLVQDTAKNSFINKKPSSFFHLPDYTQSDISNSLLCISPRNNQFRSTVLRI